jgi:hypothetical protein
VPRRAGHRDARDDPARRHLDGDDALRRRVGHEGEIVGGSHRRVPRLAQTGDDAADAKRWGVDQRQPTNRGVRDHRPRRAQALDAPRAGERRDTGDDPPRRRLERDDVRLGVGRHEREPGSAGCG